MWDVNREPPSEVADGSVSRAIVEAIADKEGLDPVELTPPLYEVIDPDALERIFADTSTVGSVTFTYENYEVTVRSDDHISVEKRRE